VVTPKELLARTTTIAVVGASRDPDKSAGAIPMGLLAHGWDILPVNPKVPELFGRRAYPSLAEVPGTIDLVLVFRPSRDAPEIARQAVARGARALWLQSGIRSDEARRIAEAGGLDYVEDRCISVERSIHRISPPRR